jgi:hypothetical protein
MKKLLVLSIVFATAVPRTAATITVNQDGSADYTAIKPAVFAANDFDTIIVADGIYTGPANRDIYIFDKTLTVRSANGPANCIINCQATEENPHVGFWFVSSEGLGDSTIQGFTIGNCLSSGDIIGSAIASYRYETKIINCIFLGNLETAVAYREPWACKPDYYAEVIKCTFYDNVWAVGAVGTFDDHVKLRNCIIMESHNSPGIWEGGIPQLKCGYAVVTADFCILQGNWYGTSSIVCDPNFVDPDGGDFHLKSQTGRWDPNSKTWFQDAITSPGIDAGDPCSDYSGELWPHGGRINVGAYGGTAEASMSLSTVGNIADLNKDNEVDLADVSAFGTAWQDDNPPRIQDLDRDGSVGLPDAAIIAENWLWPQ